MTSSTYQPPTSDHSLYVAFHITDDVSTSASVARLMRLMESTFGTLQMKAVETSGTTSKEVIFKVQKPLLNTADAQLEFFQKLESVMIATSIYSPHFTQYSPQSSRGKK